MAISRSILHKLCIQYFFSEHFGDALSNGVLSRAVKETFPDEIVDLILNFANFLEKIVVFDVDY